MNCPCLNKNNSLYVQALDLLVQNYILDLLSSIKLLTVGCVACDLTARQFEERTFDCAQKNEV